MRLTTASRPVTGEATPPPSKSMTHRVLVAAALSPGQVTRVVGPLEAEDTHLTREALSALGALIETESHAAGTSPGSPGPGSAAAGEPPPSPVWSVRGWPAGGAAGRAAAGAADAGGAPAGAAGPGQAPTLTLGNSGTSLRLLLPVAALDGRRVTLDGVPRLRQRPVGPLAEALVALGVEVGFAGEPGCPPVTVRGPLQGGSVALDASGSSQFLSGLLMAAAGAGIDLEVEATALASRPYVDLTLEVLRRFGADVRVEGRRYRTSPGTLRSPGTFVVEKDASAAAFLLAAGAVTGGRVRVHGVGRASLQGDRVFADLLGRMGCTVRQGEDWTEVEGPLTGGLDVDLNDVPDLVPPLAAVALFAPGASRFRGIGHLRLKESDRIEALASETTRLGARVTASHDELVLAGAPPESRAAAGLSGAGVRAHGDHRIAMALAVAALRVPGVELDDAACVAKSYPRFFDDLHRLVAGSPPA